ncbi:MAG: heavy-metal-associated domain-containing protein [Polyangiaceae bacterium]
MGTTRTTRLRVRGMSCGSCVHHVRTALGDLEGVRRVDVRLREGEVTVEHDPDRPLVTEMIEAVEEIGYIVSTTPDAEEGRAASA